MQRSKSKKGESVPGLFRNGVLKFPLLLISTWGDTMEDTKVSDKKTVRSFRTEMRNMLYVIGLESAIVGFIFGAAAERSPEISVVVDWFTYFMGVFILTVVLFQLWKFREHFNEYILEVADEIRAQEGQ